MRKVAILLIVLRLPPLVLLGGSGKDNLRAKNIDFLSKWLGRYENEDSTLWRIVVKSKFGQNFTRDSHALKKRKTCSPWKEIAKATVFLGRIALLKWERGPKCSFGKTG